MPDVIVLRLHPDKPISGAEFTSYLDGSTPGNPNTRLSITAFDISFGNLVGTQINQAQRIPPDDSQVPPVEDSQNRIFQHFDVIDDPNDPNAPPQKITRWHSVATAVIDIPPGVLPEYDTSDVRLDIQRDGQQIVDRNRYYNVPISVLPDLTNHSAYAGLNPSIFLALSKPGFGLDPNAAQVELPSDGSPPNFTTLRTAVERVLAADPGGGAFDLAQLTPEQCVHIAREIAWNRVRDPLPVPARPLQDMYTTELLPRNERDRIRVDADRRTLEAKLFRYIAMHNGESERLAKFIFSLSAAIACEQLSDAQKRAAFRFPVDPTQAAVTGKIAEAEVTLTNP